MQANDFPPWFTLLAAQPDTIRAAFSKKFLLPSNRTNDASNELIELFGRTNQYKIAPFLCQQLRDKYQKLLKTQKERFQKILEIALKPLSQNRLPNPEDLRVLYEFSIFSSENIHDCVIREIALYILSLSMPYQEGRLLRCHTITAVARKLEERQKELEEAVTVLFQQTVEDIPRLTLRQEQLLFQSAALIGHGKTITWGGLLFLWIKISKEGQSKIPALSANLCFDKILVAENRPVQHIAELLQTSFQEFAIEQTFTLLFHHPQSLFPPGILEDSLRGILQRSVRAQQDIVFFIDYLSHLPRSNHFPFDEALDSLQLLIPDPASEHYVILVTAIHFLNCKYKLSPEKEEEQGLLQAIHSLMQAEHKFHYKSISENFLRDPLPFPLLAEMVSKKRISLLEAASMVIKFACTGPKTHHLVPCPYLNMEGHLRLIEMIERDLGLILPPPIIADFLFFQTAKPAIFEKIQILIHIRLTIDKEFLDTVAIPQQLYGQWETVASTFLDSIDLNPREKLPNYLGDRLSKYPLKMIQFAACLQLSVYPQPMIPIRALMPCGVEENRLKFNDAGERQINCVMPLLDDFPNGLNRQCQWIFDPMESKAVFTVSLNNFLENPLFSCSFQTFLDIPQSEDIQKAFFILLSALVDDIGKEALNDNDVENLQKIETCKPYVVPIELLKREGDSSEIFDALVSCSPLLTQLWIEQTPLLGDEAARIKTNLFGFIKAYRSNFKRAFYTILNQEVKNLPMTKKNQDIKSLL